MSFDWAAVDQRERNKLDRDRQLKEFLRVQQEEAKDRKIRERREGLDDVKRIISGPGNLGAASAAEAPRAVGGIKR
ncbi:hypothetical protein HK097_001013 [Rhizophlyctis rosea]|uniref:Uncharacterized protein n=1 Tax=Rhizophlyctis rosea TaxID=64517 RepID=A0AAD5S4V4_9FUNG|nr:hypothetical protein HK097_001013 [Rhizophlyctis rosea]